jgi:hypothetical protein
MKASRCTFATIDAAAMKRQAEAAIPTVILVRIDYTVEPKGHHAIRDFELFFQQASLDFFSNTTYLASGRTRIPIAQYLRPGPQSPRPVFVFPRTNPSGQPILPVQDESLFLETQIDLRKLGGQQKLLSFAGVLQRPGQNRDFALLAIGTPGSVPFPNSVGLPVYAVFYLRLP